MSRAWSLLAILAIAGGLAAMPAAVQIGPQQLVYQAQSALADGTRVGIFLPAFPVALGLQSRSGPRVLTIGDILRCKPFDEEIEMYRKAANGQFEPFNGHQQLLNCGPMTAGGADRILAVVGIQWRQ
jgi:hypothetical protein